MLLLQLVKHSQLFVHIIGDFNTTPDRLKANKGCPTCGKLKRKSKLTSTHEKTIKDIEEIFPNKFEYIEEFSNYDTYVNVYCKIENHGIFSTCPRNLKKKIDCPKCRDLKPSKRTLSFEDNILAFKVVHKDKYAYPENTINISKKIRIICKLHR